MPPRKTRIILLKLSTNVLKAWLDHARVVTTSLGHVRGEQRSLRFTVQQRDATDVPLKLAAIDTRAAEGTGSHSVFLQGRSAAWAMKRCGLRRRWGQHVAFALEIPTLANVIGHLRRRTTINAHYLGVVCFKHQVDIDDRGFQSADVFDIEGADDYPFNFSKSGWVPLEQTLAGDLAEIGRKLIKRGSPMAAGIMRLSVKRIGKVGKNNFREVGIEFS